MTKEEHQAFCDELAELMRKHKVAGLAGIWFGKSGSGAGVLRFADAADFAMKDVTMVFADDLTKKMQDLRPGISPEHLRRLHQSDSENN